MILHSYTIKNNQAEYKAYSDGKRTLVVFQRLNPNACIQRIKASDLPKEASRKISKRQQSYIDEFVFYKLANGNIQAWYANELLATWDGKGWVW